MKYQLAPDLRKKLKRLKKKNKRLFNSFWRRLEIFEKNHKDGILDNHPLKRDLKGFRSIDITEDNKYAAIFEEIKEDDEVIAYFTEFGHKKKELYNKKR